MKQPRKSSKESDHTNFINLRTSKNKTNLSIAAPHNKANTRLKVKKTQKQSDLSINMGRILSQKSFDLLILDRGQDENDSKLSNGKFASSH